MFVYRSIPHRAESLSTGESVCDEIYTFVAGKHMRVITWNCNMKFRDKNKHIMEFNPDILVIQECENVNYYDYINHNSFDYRWFGDNKNKGMAVFTFNMQIRNSKLNDKYKYISEISINSDLITDIFAVWAMNNKFENKKRYIAQVGLYLEENIHKINKTSLVVGDFNSNKIWDNDKPLKIFNHTDVVNKLTTKGLRSIYHSLYNEQFGEESINTFYMYRKDKLKFHIDYCFCDYLMLNRISKCTIGDYLFWKQYSDHVPMIIDISNNGI